MSNYVCNHRILPDCDAARSALIRSANVAMVVSLRREDRARKPFPRPERSEGPVWRDQPRRGRWRTGRGADFTGRTRGSGSANASGIMLARRR